MTSEAQSSVAAAPAQLEHKPFVPESTVMPELTLAPVIVGAILGIVFGASSLYLVLQVGMTVSASIPIAVLSITLFRVFGGGANILQNNIVQTTGSAGESIAFGVGVTMPALLILGYDLELIRVMLVAVLGGLLGVLMMIPLRRVFIVKQHGKLIYPEGVACADVLIVGEKGGSSAAKVFGGFGLAFVYQFLMDGFKFWLKEPMRLLKFGAWEFKGASVALEASPALLGVGYVIGPRIACIMVGGGILASWVLIPAIKLFGDGLDLPLYPGKTLIRDMPLEDIWHYYVLYIGAGAVATGGIISMFQSMPTILHTLKAGFGDLFKSRPVRAAFGSQGGGSGLGRLDRDMSMRIVIVGTLALIFAIRFAPVLQIDWPSALLIVLFGFLFVTVSARLTGEIGSSSNPISGMTVATLLLTCLVFVFKGWTGEWYRVAAISIAAIVCIACSNGGTVAQCLKTGYLVGATPRHQQVAILVGALTSALVIGVTLLLLNDSKTVYSAKNLPTVKIDQSRLVGREKPHGEYSETDTNEYGVLQAREGQIDGVPGGKYLVDDTGAIRYLVDPGINGRLTVTDGGDKVDKFRAPKATLMSFIVDGILTQKLPWSLVLLGVAIAIVLELAGVPSLPFAVGVYLPLSASTPIFFGGVTRWITDKMAKRSAAESDLSPGVLLSSGYIAGGTIAAILCAFMTLDTMFGKKNVMKPLLDVGGQSMLADKIGALGIPFLDAEFINGPGMTLIPFCFLVLVLLIIGGQKDKRSAA